MNQKKIIEKLKAAGIEVGIVETKLEGTARERKLKQGRDRVTEIYKGTDWLDRIDKGMDGLLAGLPPWGTPVLLKEAWNRGDTYFDVPGLYRYKDIRTKPPTLLYYGQSECSIRARTYKFLRHTRFADEREVTKDGRLRCNEQHSKTWVFKLGRTYQELIDHVTVEYLPLPKEKTKLVESALLAQYYRDNNSLPLLNSSF